jgi:hypothetical protein
MILTSFNGGTRGDTSDPAKAEIHQDIGGGHSMEIDHSMAENSQSSQISAATFLA